MLTLFIALLMLFIGYHVGAAHLVERLSKRVHEGTLLPCSTTRKQHVGKKLATRKVSQNE